MTQDTQASSGDSPLTIFCPNMQEDQNRFLKWMQHETDYRFLHKFFPKVQSPTELFAQFLHFSNHENPPLIIRSIKHSKNHQLLGHCEIKTTAKTSSKQLELIYIIHHVEKVTCWPSGPRIVGWLEIFSLPS